MRTFEQCIPQICGQVLDHLEAEGLIRVAEHLREQAALDLAAPLIRSAHEAGSAGRSRSRPDPLQGLPNALVETIRRSAAVAIVGTFREEALKKRVAALLAPYVLLRKDAESAGSQQH